jgi:hypothetical protein
MVVLVALGGTGAVARAQGLDAELDQAVQLLEELEWEAAVVELNRLLEGGQLNKDQSARALRVLAEAHISLENDSLAVDAYKRLVKTDRSFNMRSLGKNPLPTLLKNFGQAVLEVRDEEYREYNARLMTTSKKTAFMRSAIFPGWGQRYQGYRSGQYLMLGLTAASIGYAVFADIAYRDARDKYDAAPEGADFEDLFLDLKDKSDQANLTIGLVGVVWFFNMIDAAVRDPNVRGSNLTQSTPGLSLAPVGGRGGIQLVLAKHF